MSVWPQLQSRRFSGTSSRSAPTSPCRSLFWYIGLIPDLATLRDRAVQVAPAHLRLSRAGVARQQPPLAHYERAYLILAGHLDAAGALRAQRRLLRLRDVGSSGLAHDDLPALLRRGRHLQRLRDGADAGHSARKFYHLSSWSPSATSSYMGKFML